MQIKSWMVSTLGHIPTLVFFRDTITTQLEGGYQGTKYPTLILHSDCDGEWNVEECGKLEQELQSIAACFRECQPVEFSAEWQRGVAKSLGLHPENLYESFIDVDGEPLIERLLSLCQLALTHHTPILFQ
jgi:hypothetical protein